MNSVCFAMAYSLAMLFLSGGWLWVLLRRRNWWLRYIAMEATFYSRLHLPACFIAASRKFCEGRAAVYVVAGVFVMSVALLVVSLAWWVASKSG